ncbi:phage/plasmid replication domain-containing protein [Pseudomonas sp. KNUC1026]|uniref:phage/plasmid replication domain-containing protein n=1 Tax=Pseudomonas sp. KNUC1026 TaxID=2893890 RepID=UPI003FA777AE
MQPRTYSQIRADLSLIGITDTQALNNTCSYALLWAVGEQFDLSKSAVKVVRARLRKIGIDIAKPFDGSIDLSSK